MQNLQVVLDEATGYVSSIISKGVETSVDQRFFYYEALEGNNLQLGNRSSGAYVFHPANDEAIQIGTSAFVEVYKGMYITNSMTYENWRFNAAFTRALQ